MEWYWVLLALFGGLILLMLTSMPIAFCFLLINLMGLFFYFGTAGLEQLGYSMFASVDTFTLIPIPLFLLMGDVLFYSGLAPQMIRTLDKWLGRLPGRLSLLTVAAGVLFSVLTGTSMASVAMLGSTLCPEMEKKGYAKSMILGPILGAGGLAMMIPPSSLAVLACAIGQISVGKTLIAIIVPGLLMAVIYAVYIILRAKLQPTLAPSYDVSEFPLSEKLIDSVKYILPVAVIVFLVVGVIFVGVATPSEAAATGALGTVILAACYGKMNWQVAKKSLTQTITVTGMVFLIIAGATAFSQILAFSGASTGLSELTVKLAIAPIMIIILMQIVVLILGCFMSVVAIMMITLPIFMPVVHVLGFDPVWFAVIFLINIEIAGISPPFGMSLFVMKAVAPPDTTMGDVFKAGAVYSGLGLFAMALIIIFPQIALKLPALMMR